MSGSRAAMTRYWVEQATDSASVVEMMMDTDAHELGMEELPEVMSHIPDYTGMRVLELGAGIGRYSRVLAEKSKQVVAVDFMKEFMDENEKSNGHLKNIDFLVADATKIKMKARSFDMVFTNWLLMYLVDKEAEHFFRNVLEWLDEDGYLFIHESILYTGGNKPRGDDPTCYRDTPWYDAAIDCASIDCDDTHCYKYNVILSKSLKTYIKNRNNPNQVIWLLQKVKREKRVTENNNIQRYLDSVAYTNNKILTCEQIFGRNFLNFGGLQVTKLFLSSLKVKKIDNVLDFGCGIGGTSIYIAKEYGAKVVGVDTSCPVVKMATKRTKEAGLSVEQVHFEMIDPLTRQYPPASFDIIFSRDTILRVDDKLSLFKKFRNWLKPGGRLLVSDYCCSDGQLSESFEEYVTEKGYRVQSTAWYSKALQTAGLTNVRTEDKTELFVEAVKKTISKAQLAKKEFVEELNEDEFNDMVNDWKFQLQQAELGQLTWGLFYAENA